ncbi:MAG: FkbM family methyltransferase [Rhodospirillales bacterium]|nr:FkbM family methyltransferase [Rhodospirillales bacterium]
MSTSVLPTALTVRTPLLEEHGWKGICIDPFPTNMESRTCTMFKEVVDSEAGRTVEFHNPGKFLGGIVGYAGFWVKEEEKGKENTITLTTTTLADILDRAKAPSFINYMSVDIEGAEYDALKAFPFDRYTIGALSIEHNNIEERRLKIRSLLEAKGYMLDWSIRDQDWYIFPSRV